MRPGRLVLLAAAFAAAARAETDKAAADPVQGMAAMYRAGRIPETLDRAADALERDPSSREVRHYLWTVGRRLAAEEEKAVLPAAEREAAVRLAEERLAEQRRRAEQTLAELRGAYERSRHVQSPEDLLAGAEGMGKFLEGSFEEERSQALAVGYFKGLVENLSAGLKGKVFVTRKDQLVAAAWLDYYGGRRTAALRKWEQAVAEDPADKDVANNLDRLRRVLKREKDEQQIRSWSTQAATYQETGFHREALDLWEKVMALEPGRADVQRSVEECRAAIAGKEKEARLAALTEEGVRLYQRGETIEAAQAWFKVLEQEPSYKQARVWLSHAGRQLKASEPAAPAAERSRDPRPADPGGQDRAEAMELYKKGLIAYSQDQVAEAVEFWKKALELAPDLTQAQQSLRQARAELSFKKSAGR